ncbi:hypothetical protein NG795_24870 [Laspinema sp. D3]|nr:hypothetical protein [Laspinema sp. D2c]
MPVRFESEALRRLVPNCLGLVSGDQFRICWRQVALNRSGSVEWFTAIGYEGGRE